SFQAEPPPRYPHERMEPIHRTDEPRDHMRDRVATPNVLEFVNQRSLQRGVAPGFGVGWEDDHRTNDAACHRTGDRIVQQHIDTVTRHCSASRPRGSELPNAVNLPEPQSYWE